MGSPVSKCPVCNGEVPAYTSFCTHCGTRLYWPPYPGPAQAVHPAHHHGTETVIALVLIGILAWAAMTSAYLAIPGANTITSGVRSIYNYFRCATIGPCGTTTTGATAGYDQQIALVYDQDYSFLSSNVVLVVQNDPNGFGPAYLLNGLSNTGWWYQVGVTWNWPLASGRGYSSGLHFVWEVFAPNGTTTPPLLTNFSGSVRQGDNLFLSLSFSAGSVVMYGFDNSTGASASHSYSAMGASLFVGRSGSSSSQFFTGLMTEWYHANSNETRMAQVSYSMGQAVPSAWICIDEFVVATHSQVYAQCTTGPLILGSVPQSYTFHGLTASASRTQFSTGPS